MGNLSIQTQNIIYQDIYQALQYKLNNKQIAQRVAQAHNLSETALLPIVKKLRKKVNRAESREANKQMDFAPFRSVVIALVVFCPIGMFSIGAEAVGPALVVLEGVTMLLVFIGWCIRQVS